MTLDVFHFQYFLFISADRLKGNIKVFRMIRATLTVVLLIWTSAVYGEEREYVGEWAVQIEGGENVARRVARDTGFEFDKQVSVMHIIIGSFPHIHESGILIAINVPCIY